MTTPEIINTGDLPNDGAGDPLRLAFDKINTCFMLLDQKSKNFMMPSLLREQLSV